VVVVLDQQVQVVFADTILDPQPVDPLRVQFVATNASGALTTCHDRYLLVRKWGYVFCFACSMPL